MDNSGLNARSTRLAEAPGSLEPIAQQSTPERAARQIRDAILQGRFPPGARLNEAQIAGELRVSRAPVREAFQRLIQEGLLRGERNRGVFVVSLSDIDSDDLYFARAVVERAAAAVSGRGEEVLAELDALVDQMSRSREADWPELVELDLTFHRYLVDSAGSPRLSRMFDSLSAETSLTLLHNGALSGDRSEFIRDHRDITEALKSGDPEAIEAVIGTHMSNAAARTRAKIARQGPPPAETSL
jgi:DNA-binding GntR family transcriptional regulator